MREVTTLGVEFVLAANAAILLSVALLWLANGLIGPLGLTRDWALRRRLTTTAWVSALVLPAFAFMAPHWLPTSGMNATDLLVAHFLRGNIDITATELAAILSLRNTVPQALLTPTTPIWTGLVLVLSAAALLRAAYIARSAWRLHRTLAATTVLRHIGRVTIHISSDCAVPFASRGLTRYHVVLPAYLVTDARAFRIALGHELQHIRQGDPLLELAVAALSPIFALNPAFWALARHTRRLREHDCDAACVARPRGNTRDYSLTLLAVANRASADRFAPGTFSVPFLGRRQMGHRATRSQLGNRIELLAQGPGRRANLVTTAALICALCAALAGTAWLLRSPTDWSHERLELSSVLNLERLETINTLGQRPLR
ncbi:MAG: M56 family metallopeptidase [Pseudomonadota bacterium]